MAKISTLIVELKADTKQLVAALARGAGAVKGFAGKVASGSMGLAKFGGAKAIGGIKMLGGAFASLAGLAAKAAAAIATGAVAFAGWGIKLAAEAEQAEIAFTTMLGSGDKAKKMLEEITEFAANTPFNLPEVREAAKKLVAFGYSAEEVIPQARRLGDIASTIGVPFSELASIIGKMKMGNLVQAEEIGQLAERGLPVYQEFAKILGVTEDEVKGLGSAGKINFEILQQAIENMTNAGGIAHNAMENQSKSLAGIWSNLQDSIGQVATKVGQILIEAFDLKGLVGDGAGFFTWINKKLDELKPLIMQIAAAFMAMVKTIFGAVKNLGVVVGGYLTSVFETFFGKSDGWFEGLVKWYIWVEFFWTNFTDYAALSLNIAWLKIVEFGNDFKHFFTDTLPAFLKGFGSGFITFNKNLGSNLVEGWTEIFDFIKSGGQDSIDFTFKSLNEGWEQAAKDMAQRPERVATEYEKLLRQTVDSQTDDLGKKLDAFYASKLAAAAEDVADTGEQAAQQVSNAAKDSFDPSKLSGATGALQGSKEAFDIIRKARSQSGSIEKIAQKQLDVEKQSKKTLDEIKLLLGANMMVPAVL